MNRSAFILAGAVLAGLLTGIAVAVPATAYATGGVRLIGTSISQDARERVEYYAPPRWRMWWLSTSGRRYDMPAFARLVRIRDSRPLGDSGVFDLSGEWRAFWTRDGVQIGTSASFDRSTGRWTIIQQ